MEFDIFFVCFVTFQVVFSVNNGIVADKEKFRTYPGQMITAEIKYTNLFHLADNQSYTTRIPSKVPTEFPSEVIYLIPIHHTL